MWFRFKWTRFSIVYTVVVTLHCCCYQLKQQLLCYSPIDDWYRNQWLSSDYFFKVKWNSRIKMISLWWGWWGMSRLYCLYVKRQNARKKRNLPVTLCLAPWGHHPRDYPSIVLRSTPADALGPLKWCRSYWTPLRHAKVLPYLRKITILICINFWFRLISLNADGVESGYCYSYL